MPSTLSTTLALVLALHSAPVASQESKRPSRAEIDKILNNAVEQFNAKMIGTKVDEITVIRMMTYDEAIPTLGYLYATRYFDTTGQRKVTSEYVASIREFNVARTCTSPFAPLMRAYGLQVVHSFSDATTGAKLVELKITREDCRRSGY